MARNVIGIVSPGAMGSGLGRAWQAGGARVVVTVAGRSARTRDLASGLEWLPDLEAVVGAADVIVSVGPPAHAVQMAGEIARACLAMDRRPLVVDVNAISPATLHEVGAALARAGCELLDGSVSGPPPVPSGSTILYLSGPAASRVAALPAPGVKAQVVGDRSGLASAIKMCTASVYKGFAALLLQALQTSHSHGVTDVVLADLAEEFGPQLARVARRLASAAAKSSRYVGEMREIARTQEAAGASPALFEAMAVVYEQVSQTALATHTPEEAARAEDLARVLGELGARRQ
jgi:3-hydroxyisobutyrate dehydrogenase-like beta-hydroxyacid dehydrogenase